MLDRTAALSKLGHAGMHRLHVAVAKACTLSAMSLLRALMHTPDVVWLAYLAWHAIKFLYGML